MVLPYLKFFGKALLLAFIYGKVRHQNITKGSFMTIVMLTALGVGGATIVGAIIGFIFKKISHKFSDIVLSFAAGIMMAAAILGLILPAIDYGFDTFRGINTSDALKNLLSVLVTVAGIFTGALCINLLDKLVPHLHRLVGVDHDGHSGDGKSKLDKVLLFVMAIAIHNLPEGIAAGVGFGAENTADALLIAGGIALQNIPEGMVIIGPMLAAGIKPRRTLICAFATGVIEIIGTFLGYFAVSVFSALLPFALAFAGGTMLYVISDEMIPETHSHGTERGATYSLLVGFCVMVLMSVMF